MDSIFKPIEAQDIPAIVALMEDFYAIDNYPIDTAVARDLLMEFTENETLGKGWMIMAEGKTVGYVILTFVFSFEYKGRIAFLDELYIADQARGMGLGKRALDFIQQECKLYSVKIIYLEVEPHNEKAQQLYLSKKFSMHNRKLMKHVIV